VSTGRVRRLFTTHKFICSLYCSVTVSLPFQFTFIFHICKTPPQVRSDCSAVFRKTCVTLLIAIPSVLWPVCLQFLCPFLTGEPGGLVHGLPSKFCSDCGSNGFPCGMLETYRQNRDACGRRTQGQHVERVAPVQPCLPPAFSLSHRCPPSGARVQLMLQKRISCLSRLQCWHRSTKSLLCGSHFLPCVFILVSHPG
jgi:hypothetical protein